MQQFAWHCGAITRLVRWVPDGFQHARAANNRYWFPYLFPVYS